MLGTLIASPDCATFCVLVLAFRRMLEPPSAYEHKRAHLAWYPGSARLRKTGKPFASKTSEPLSHLRWWCEWWRPWDFTMQNM